MKKLVKEGRRNKQADVLIIGAGIAGLSLGIKLAQQFCDKKITILSKDGPGESNTRYAQGGIAAVMDLRNDSFQAHIEDTLLAGDGYCNENVVERVVKDGPERLAELMGWGASFDKGSNGLDLGLEGGHSIHRIVHSRDETGFHIVTILLRIIATLPNVEILWNTLVVDLLIERDKSYIRSIGAVYISEGSVKSKCITATCTVLATGGIGQVYQVTTNPKIASGDGVAMAYRAGAKVRDMQFVQFHPTAFSAPQRDTVFLISEALRGFGAYLITGDGDRFMFKYDKRGEMASRDIVARAIYEISSREGVYLDCRHLDKMALMHQFRNIYQKCLSFDVDIVKDLIPVLPAAHYLCGGIETNLSAQTSINKLYAIGECAHTGMHGANRLASNSLLEALVFSHHCFLDIGAHMSCVAETAQVDNSKLAKVASAPVQDIMVIQSKLKWTMSHYAGIIRTNDGLKKGLQIVKNLSDEMDAINSQFGISWIACETRNLLVVASLILDQSLDQKENRGTFYNRDLRKIGNKNTKGYAKI